MTNFEEQIKSNCIKLPFERVTLPRLDQVDLANIVRGAVFVFAVWSAASTQSFRFFTETLGELPPPELAVIVLDTDSIDYDAFISLFSELPQGKGECYWIKAGRVTHRDHGYTAQTTKILRERIQEIMT